MERERRREGENKRRKVRVRYRQIRRGSDWLVEAYCSLVLSDIDVRDSKSKDFFVVKS